MANNLPTHLLHALAHHHQAKRLRYRNTPHHQHINFFSNDYLKLSQHPSVIAAFIKGARLYGLGSGGSALVAGYTSAHSLLEEAFAEFLGRERALLFNSGYHANIGVISTFANRKSVIVADKLCHASLQDGALLARARYHRYRHQDILHAEQYLKQAPPQNTLLLVESVFSMQGNITDMPAYVTLATKHQAFLIVDDAHGIGILGANGKGVSEQFHLTNHDIPCLITPLGKALGSLGAMVSGSHEMIDALLQLTRTYRYSTALPPAVCQATLAGLRLLQTETWRLQQLKELILFFNNEATLRNIPLAYRDLTPIKSIIIGDNAKARLLQQQLQKENILTACMLPPTVPHRAASLRISLHCFHEKSDILHLLDCLHYFLFSSRSS